MCKFSIVAALHGGENSRAVQKWHCFSLLPSCLVHHTLLCRVIPHAVWFRLIFKSLTLPGSGEHCQKYIFDSDKRETPLHLHSLSVPAAHSLTEGIESG